MTDLFPAVVATYPPDVVAKWESPYLLVAFAEEGATRYNECRVIVHNNLVTVGADSPRGPVAVFKSGVAQVFVEKPYIKVLTDTGWLVVFAPSNGCGCGTRLRSWNPYGNVIGSSRG